MVDDRRVGLGDGLANAQVAFVEKPAADPCGAVNNQVVGGLESILNEAEPRRCTPSGSVSTRLSTSSISRRSARDAAAEHRRDGPSIDEQVQRRLGKISLAPTAPLGRHQRSAGTVTPSDDRESAPDARPADGDVQHQVHAAGSRSKVRCADRRRAGGAR